MILLSGHSLTPVRKIRAEAMSVTMRERDSSASITPEDMTGIGMDNWMLSDSGIGNGTVWVVKSIRQAFLTDTKTVELEHAINTLRNRILFGEIGPSQIKGVVGATTCTAKEAIDYILAQQSDWVLDAASFAYGSVSNPYKFDGEDLYSALEKVSDTLTDPWWSFDFSSYPFKLKITQKPAGVACELRPGRNLTTLTRTVDKSGMFTRFYPIGKDDLHITGTPYVSKNENLYGVISKVETDEELTTSAELTAWATEELNRHAEPNVSITADGLALAEATGESLDSLTLGRLCQIPLNEYNTTITERIIEITCQDEIHAPTVLRISLANKLTDITKIVADSLKKSGKRSRGYGKQSKEDHAWIEDTDDHVRIVAEAVAGTIDGHPNWSRLSELTVGQGGIDGRVTLNEDGIAIAQGRLDVHDTDVALVVTKLDNRPVKVYANTSAFPATGSASYVYLANDTGKYYQWTNGAYAEFNYQKVNAAGITAEINADNTTTTRIKGNKIVIGENTTTGVSITDAFAIETYNGIQSIKLKKQTFSEENFHVNGADLYVQPLLGSGGKITAGSELHVGTGGSLIFNDRNDVSSVAIKRDDAIGFLDTGGHVALTESNNVYTLWYLPAKTYKSSSIETPSVANGWVNCGTFSRATTLSGGWSGGKCTVYVTTDQSIQYYTQLTQGTVSWSGNTATVPVNAYDNGQTQYERPTDFSITVDASGRYNAGRTQGHTDYTAADITATSKKSGTSSTWYVSITRNDASTQTLELNASSIYTDARSGYYTQAQYDARYSEGGQSAWMKYTDNDQPKSTNWGLAPGKYMTGFYRDANGTMHEWDTSWGPVPSGAAIASSNIQIDTYEYKTSQPSGTQAQNMWTSIKNGWNDPTMKYWRFRVYVQNPSATSQILASKYYWFQYT